MLDVFGCSDSCKSCSVSLQSCSCSLWHTACVTDGLTITTPVCNGRDSCCWSGSSPTYRRSSSTANTGGQTRQPTQPPVVWADAMALLAIRRGYTQGFRFASSISNPLNEVTRGLARQMTSSMETTRKINRSLLAYISDMFRPYQISCALHWVTFVCRVTTCTGSQVMWTKASTSMRPPKRMCSLVTPARLDQLQVLGGWLINSSWLQEGQSKHY